MSISLRNGTSAPAGVFGLMEIPTEQPDRPDHRGGIVLRFQMKREQIGAGIGKRFDVPERTGDHQVCVKQQAGTGTERLYERRTECDVRHKMAVHHIQVNHVASGFFHHADIGCEICKIRRQDGWRYQNAIRRHIIQHLFHSRFPLFPSAVRVRQKLQIALVVKHTVADRINITEAVG